MKFLFDFFPILLFFIAYKLYDIFVATATAIIASGVQVVLYWLRYRRFENMHLITLGLLVVLGGATIWLHNPEFIMWKVTAVNWLFTVILLASQFIGDKPLMQRLMGKQVDIPQPIWPRLNAMWAGFFFVIGTVNIYFALNAVNARTVFFQGARLSSDSVVTQFTCQTDFPPDIALLCAAAQNFESTWVDFKFYGVLGLTLLFGIAQAFYLVRHMPPEEQ